jgi:putative transcriptional regulator
MDSLDLAAGDWLVSPPSMKDPRFANSVVMLTYHNDNSLGFCLNKSLKHRFNDVVGTLSINLNPEPEIFWGGPVNQNTVWMIHDDTWGHPASIAIDENWNVLSHVTMFDDFNDDHKPNDFKILLGCSSWAPNQLISELRGDPPWNQNHSWLILKKPDPSLITEIDPEDLWKIATDLCLRQSVSQLMS